MVGQSHSHKNGQKMMLGFVVRWCAADLGHMPTPEEFAAWANERDQNGHRYCLFGKPISATIAKVMLRHPGRLVTVRSEAVSKNGKRNGR